MAVAAAIEAWAAPALRSLAGSNVMDATLCQSPAATRRHSMSAPDTAAVHGCSSTS